MRVLVLGGTGFIGPAAVHELCRLGHDVTVFHRGQTETSLPDGVRHLHGDRTRLAEHAGTLRGLRPDVVLDMRMMTEADARAVLEVFHGAAGRLVVASSMDVYRAYDRFRGADPGEPDPVPLTEDSPLRDRLYPYRQDPPRPQNDPRSWMDEYDKVLVERTARSATDLPATMLRLPMVYGPGDRQHRLFPYLRRMDHGRPAILLPESLADWCAPRGYVDEVGRAIALAVSDERAAGQVYNVAEREAHAEKEWVRRIAHAAGWEGEVVLVPDADLPEVLRPGIRSEQQFSPDTSRIRDELGYAEVVPGDLALRLTVEWERAHPPAVVDAEQFDYAAEDRVLAALAGK